MIVTKRESMASLIHDTSPTLCVRACVFVRVGVLACV